MTDKDKKIANLEAANRELVKQIGKLRRQIDEYGPVIEHVDAMVAAIERDD